MFRVCLTCLSAGVSLLAISPALADTGADDLEGDTIVVIGTREDARLSTGSAVVIDEAELERFEFTNIHAILRSVPGVYVREEDGLGTFPRIGIRAASSGRSDRVTVLEDGVPAAMAAYGNTSAYYFPTAGRMSGIEVLKGPEILRYGPQTTSGVINLLSTAIPDGPAAFVNAELGAWNTRRLHAWAGGTSGGFGGVVETWQHRTDGFQRIDRSDRTAGNDVREYMAKLRWTSPDGVGPRQVIEFKWLRADNEADVSYLGLTDADFRRDPDRRYGLSELERMDQGRRLATLRHEIALSPGVSLSTTGYYVETFRDYRRLNQINGINIGVNGVVARVNAGGADATLLQGILDGTRNTTSANGVRYGNNFQAFTSRGVQMEARGLVRTGAFEHELMGGVRIHQDETANTATVGNLIYDQRNGSLVFNRGVAGNPTEGFARATSVWVGDRIRTGGLILLPLLRHETIRTRADRADPASARNRLSRTSLGLGVNYEIDPRWTLLAGIHQGFAPPGANAVEGSRGEESVNVEGGVRYRAGTISVDAVGFYTDYKNALRNCLVANPCADGAIDGVQQDGAKEVHGLELGVDAVAWSSGALSVPVRLAYTFTDGGYTRGADVASGVRAGDVLDYTPRHIGRVELGVEETGGGRINVALNHADGACITTTCGREGVDTRFLRTEALFTADLAASYPVTPVLEVYGRIENLFDQRRIVHRGSDGARGNPGRYAAVGVRARF